MFFTINLSDVAKLHIVFLMGFYFQYISVYLHSESKWIFMAILERKIIHEIDTSCSHIIYPQFVLPRHKHAEYEIMLFTQGSGKQFVGEGVADFQEGDIALIGAMCLICIFVIQN